MSHRTFSLGILAMALSAAVVVAPPAEIRSSGVFDTPVGAMEAAPLPSGSAYEFTVTAAPGERLSFATMFVQSNDLFYAPSEGGVALFDGMGDPVEGDVTSKVHLWDAGTERNERPGAGAHQAPRQQGVDTGPADMDRSIRRIAPDRAEVPAVGQVLRVTVTPRPDRGMAEEGAMGSDTDEDAMGDGMHAGTDRDVHFTVRIENRSGDAVVPVSDMGMGGNEMDGKETMRGDEGAAMGGRGAPILLSPGAWAVHTGSGPFFTEGEPDRGAGLEALAEDGNPVPLAESLSAGGMDGEM